MININYILHITHTHWDLKILKFINFKENQRT